MLTNLNDETIYVGMTKNLQRRFNEHNQGKVRHTKAKVLLKLVWYCAFMNKEKAHSFEKYLKSHSGHAFRNKRLV